MKRFHDEIFVHVIEKVLLQNLSDILSASKVHAMPAEMIARIAGESEDAQAQRRRFTKQLAVLIKGIEVCQEFVVFEDNGKPQFSVPTGLVISCVLMSIITDTVQSSMEEEETEIEEEQPNATYNKAPEDSVLDHSNKPAPLVTGTSSHAPPAAEATEVNEEPTLVEDDEWLPRASNKKKKKKGNLASIWDAPEN